MKREIAIGATTFGGKTTTLLQLASFSSLSQMNPVIIWSGEERATEILRKIWDMPKPDPVTSQSPMFILDSTTQTFREVNASIGDYCPVILIIDDPTVITPNGLVIEHPELKKLYDRAEVVYYGVQLKRPKPRI